MNPEKYEEITFELYETIFNTFMGEKHPKITLGRTNKIEGKSGYSHQIDVSVGYDENLILVECKNWTKKVDPEKVLAFYSRILDIQANNPKTVIGYIVSTKELLRGAKILADHFKIEHQKVLSAQEFNIHHERYAMVGTADYGHGEDNVKVEKT